jgi:DNA primase
MLIDYRALRSQIPMECVLDLIDYHPTSRRGHKLRGACPFHAPELPNSRCFSVDLTRGLFRCFDCGAQGNQLDLWVRLSHLSLYEAALDLGHHAGVRIPMIDPDSAAR